jgi:enoyl-[acyl-carrier protein] reductase II
MFKTKLTEILGIEYPIIQAGMGGVAFAELAAAVSNAGGLGVVAGAMMSADDLRHQIQETKRRTSKVFGVDLLLAEGLPNTDELMDVIFEEKVPVFVSGLGTPGPWAERMREQGMKIVALVGNVRHARRCAADGVDIIVAQGHEAGGHTGRVAALALVPQVVDAVKPVPVVAAGGICDGRGFVASMALGACGVLIGTRFIATHEAGVHLNYKQKLVQIGDDDTVVTRAYTGKTLRNIRNRWTEEWKDRQSEAKPFPFQIFVAGEKMALGIRDGDMEWGFAPAGQGCGLIHEIVPAGQVVDEIMREAKEVLSGMAQEHLGAIMPAAGS